MTAWLLRTGFTRVTLEQQAMVLGWDLDLVGIASHEDVEDRYRRAYPTARAHRVRARANQMWTFLAVVQIDDLVLMPRDGSIAVARVTGEFVFRPELPAGARMTRSVEWLATDIPADAMDQSVYVGVDPQLALQRLPSADAEAQIIAALHGAFALRSGGNPSEEVFGLLGEDGNNSINIASATSELVVPGGAEDNSSETAQSMLDEMIQDVVNLDGRDNGDALVAPPEYQPDSTIVSGWPFADAHSEDAARSFIEGYAHDAIRDALWREFPGVQLVDLVTQLLHSRGYSVEMWEESLPGRKTLTASGVGNERVVLRVLSDVSPKNPYGSKGTLEDIEVFQTELQATRSDWGALLCWRGWRNRAEAAGELVPALDLLSGDDIVTAFITCYPALSDEVKARIPLKHIWILDESV